MVIVDTNVIIDHLRLQGSAKSRLRQLEDKFTKDLLAISIVTIQELYSGQSTTNSKNEDYLLETITPLQILPYTYEVSQLAGEIVRDSTVPIDFADAAIAATTIVNGAQLATLNHKHFQGIPNLELLA